MKQFDERDIWDSPTALGRAAAFVWDVVSSAHWGYWVALSLTLWTAGCV